MIYHEMMAVKNLHRKYSGLKEIRSESISHHEHPEAFTKRKEKHIQAMTEYIERRGSPFSVESETQLHNIVAKELISNEIKKSISFSQHKNFTHKGFLRKEDSRGTLYTVQI